MERRDMCRVETYTGDPVSGTIVCKTILYTRNRGSTSRIRISTLHILFTTYQRMYRVIRVTSFRRSIHYLVPSIKLAPNSTWLLNAPPQLILFSSLGVPRYILALQALTAQRLTFFLLSAVTPATSPGRKQYAPTNIRFYPLFRSTFERPPSPHPARSVLLA